MVTGVTAPKMTANVMSSVPVQAGGSVAATAATATATAASAMATVTAGAASTSTTTATLTNANVTQNSKDAGPLPAKSDRRSNKPIMEKRRRARINNCLNELKTLILDATKKDPARHSKLEKADILEKTVKHLQELQRQQAVMQQVTDPKVLNKFKTGFADCANEVSRFPGLEPVAKRRLLQHLSNCINGMKAELHHHQRQTPVQAPHQMHAQMLPSPPSSPEQDHHLHHSQPHAHHQLSQQRHAQPPQQQQQPALVSAAIGNSLGSPFTIQHTVNGHFLPNGLQVIPTKLPNGSIALVLPQNLAHQYQHQHQHQPQQQQQQTHAKPQTPQIATMAMMRQQQIIHQQQQQHPAIMVTAMTPTRTASTGSASSHSSGYERTTLSPPSGSLHPYAPPSPANSYEAMDFKPSVIQHASLHAYATQQEREQEQLLQQAHSQQPLSLVIKKNAIKEEDQPWRPW